MSATLSSTEQKVYNKVMASKKKAMTLAQIEAAIPGLSKKDMTSAINNILRLKLFTANKGKDDVLSFHAVAVEDAKKQNTLTEEQQFVLSIVEKAGNKGISRPSISNQIPPEVMPRSQVNKALEALEKSMLVKTFKSVNAPTMPLYILHHLQPPEDLAGGIWFDESKEYDSMFVDSLRRVVYRYVCAKTWPAPKGKDSINKLCPNPIYPVSKTGALPTPADVLRHIQNSKVTTAQLTIKNVMEIARALELDGLIEAIKPIGGVSVDPVSDSDDEPATKRRRSRYDSDDGMDDAERERKARKEKEKARARLKERKREERRRQRAKEREKERERKRREKEKERKRKEKERKRKEKEKARKRKEKEKARRKKYDSDSDMDSDDELRDINELDKKKRRKRVESDDDSAASSSDLSDSDSSSSSSSDSDSDSDSDDSDVSSVASEDIEQERPAVPNGISANPFLSQTGRQGINDLSDQAVVYRAIRRIRIQMGQMQSPCGPCPQFNFCQEGGPVNATDCKYFTTWLDGTEGGWTADVKNEKLRAAQEAEKERKRREAEANGQAYVEEGENGEAEGDAEFAEEEEVVEETWEDPTTQW